MPLGRHRATSSVQDTLAAGLSSSAAVGASIAPQGLSKATMANQAPVASSSSANQPPKTSKHSFPVLGNDFWVEREYEFVKELGQGAYGIVCAAKNSRTGEAVAIKKITKVFTKKILTKRALRELKLLRFFCGHKNITCLYDMDIIDPHDFQEVYLYEELMEADLHAIIRSGQPLSDAHFQSFIYQTLCGLRYIHSANVLHRDLKPGNLLVNADCELKICDFGLARGFDLDNKGNDPNGGGLMTEYVATRWYRAPEIMLSFQNYTTAIDMWSVGCILAELLGGRPIFKGKDYVDQLNQIIHYLGTPSDQTLRRVGSPRAQEYIRSLPYKAGIPFNLLYPHANPQALDLLARLLAFDPAERITCQDALRHPYLSVWYDPADILTTTTTFDFAFENEDTIEGMKVLIAEEVREFRAFVREPIQEPVRPAKRQESLPIPSREEIINSPPSSALDGEGTSMAAGGRMIAEFAESPKDEHPWDGLQQDLARTSL